MQYLDDFHPDHNQAKSWPSNCERGTEQHFGPRNFPGGGPPAADEGATLEQQLGVVFLVVVVDLEFSHPAAACRSTANASTHQIGLLTSSSRSCSSCSPPLWAGRSRYNRRAPCWRGSSPRLVLLAVRLCGPHGKVWHDVGFAARCRHAGATIATARRMWPTSARTRKSTARSWRFMAGMALRLGFVLAPSQGCLRILSLGTTSDSHQFPNMAAGTSATALLLRFSLATVRCEPREAEARLARAPGGWCFHEDTRPRRLRLLRFDARLHAVRGNLIS